MSYQIGQLRREQIDSYTTKLNYRLGLLRNENSIIDFYDQCMFLTGTNVVSALFSYYLKFTVRQLPDSPQEFTIKLQNDEVAIDNVQTVRKFTVKQGVETSTFELIFNPNSNYNQIVFELKRLASDFSLYNDDGTNGRIMDITISNFEKVNNVISDFLAQKYSGLSKLKKIGIQGPPGLLFCIDGEEIHVGRNGIYELYNDNINISYLGFVIKDALYTQNGQDYFIMDFKY